MFSKIGTYDAVGLFSKTHIISIIVCFVLIALSVVLTRKMTKQKYFLLLKVFAIITTILELIKILLSWYEKNFLLDAWLPLYFCSLFIFALWLTFFKNKVLKEIGLSYIAFASIVAGIAFIFFPTTSFTWFPIFHFRCLYSIIYHSMMVYAGIMLYITKALEIDFKALLKYCVFTLVFMLIALIININHNSNLMFVSNPGRVPLSFLHTIYEFSPALFTITMMFAHIVLMGFGMFGIVKLVKYIKNKKHQTIEEVDKIEHITT